MIPLLPNDKQITALTDEQFEQVMGVTREEYTAESKILNDRSGSLVAKKKILDRRAKAGVNEELLKEFTAANKTRKKSVVGGMVGSLADRVQSVSLGGGGKGAVDTSHSATPSTIKAQMEQMRREAPTRKVIDDEYADRSMTGRAKAAVRSRVLDFYARMEMVTGKEIAGLSENWRGWIDARKANPDLMGEALFAVDAETAKAYNDYHNAVFGVASSGLFKKSKELDEAHILSVVWNFIKAKITGKKPEVKGATELTVAGMQAFETQAVQNMEANKAKVAEKYKDTGGVIQVGVLQKLKKEHGGSLGGQLMKEAMKKKEASSSSSHDDEVKRGSTSPKFGKKKGGDDVD